VASHYLGRKVRTIAKDNSMFLDTINKILKAQDGVFRALLDRINDSTELHLILP